MRDVTSIVYFPNFISRTKILSLIHILPQARTFVTQSFIVLQIHYEMFSECSYKMIKKNLVWDDGAVKNVRY